MTLPYFSSLLRKKKKSSTWCFTWGNWMNESQIKFKLWFITSALQHLLPNEQNKLLLFPGAAINHIISLGENFGQDLHVCIPSQKLKHR